MSLKSTYKRVRPSVVSISKKVVINEHEHKYIPIGTGVYIDSAGIVLTAYHVVKGMEKLSEPDCFIVFTDQGKSETTAAEVKPYSMYANTTKDYAFLKFYNDEKHGKLDAKIFSPIKLPKVFNLECGEYVGTIGFPLRSSEFSQAIPDLYRGIISRIDYNFEYIDNVMLDINARPGNSGGPVFKIESGELIGIIKEAHMQTENLIKYDSDNCMIGIDELVVSTNMVNCIPWSHIMRDLEHVRNDFGWKSK